MRRRDLREHRPRVLRLAHDRRDAAADGADADQAPRGPQGALTAGAWSTARPRPRAGGQDPAPQARAPGHLWPRRRARPRARATTRRCPRPRDGLPVRRAGFWRGYAEVKKALRGRYPRHDWPDDPATATPRKRR
ncbi:MAG: hypothetical protein KF729_30660 [Sandaracinaceae bacterium]|nr:hypothetical protein [Sandaracinaceae bacterium]